MFHICNFPFSTVDDETILLLMIYINPFNFELLVLPTNQSTPHINIIASNVIRGRKKLREEYDIKHVWRSLRALVFFIFYTRTFQRYDGSCDLSKVASFWWSSYLSEKCYYQATATVMYAGARKMQRRMWRKRRSVFLVVFCFQSCSYYSFALVAPALLTTTHIHQGAIYEGLLWEQRYVQTANIYKRKITN